MKKHLIFLFLLLTAQSLYAQHSWFDDLVGLEQLVQNPKNPFMAADDNNMHVDSYATDVHPGPGPIGFSGHVYTFNYGLIAGECAGILFDKYKNIMTVCVKMGSTELLLIDPSTLAVLAAYKLPPRPQVLLAAVTLQFEKLMDDTSGGSYFFIDHMNRAVIATSRREILVVGQKKVNGKSSFVLEEKIDLTQAVPQSSCATLFNPDFTNRNCDKVTTVLSDFQGNYWFISRYGKIGVVDKVSREIKVLQLPNQEELQNSFSLDVQGAYIVSTHALYKLAYNSTQGPHIVWREEYDRGTGRKLGQVNQGSGTSPSLMGEKYVAIADNAEPRLNAIVYHRGELAPGQDRIVCKVPLFKEGASATENSFVVFNNSMIIENNYGYKGPLSDNFTAGGAARVDINQAGDECHVVWESDIISPTTVAKLSIMNGQVYFYTKDGNFGNNHETWSLTGLDFGTGQILTRIETGKGNSFNNNWGAISLGPDGSAYIGSFKGFIKVQTTDVFQR